ncbi:MAG: polysaccharide biosynthesis/export protein [Blastocatellia bacterium]|nr:polysaccharide biosynthesis/export protein [Blastocatellia bacterium]
METRRFFDVIYWRWSDRSSPVKQGRRFRLLLTILFLAIALDFEHNGVSGQTPKANSRGISDTPKAAACPVSVMGAVYSGGKFELRRTMRLKEVIDLAGGLTKGSKGMIRIRRRLLDDKCSAEPVIGDVQEYGAGRLDKEDSSNPIILNGDEIEVVSLDVVFVAGMVRRPEGVYVGSPITVSRAIAWAGGVLPQARQDKINLFRRAEASSQTIWIQVNLKDVKRGKAVDPVLQPGDIIDVPGGIPKGDRTSLPESLARIFGRRPVRVIY